MDGWEVDGDWSWRRRTVCPLFTPTTSHAGDVKYNRRAASTTVYGRALALLSCCCCCCCCHARSMHLCILSSLLMQWLRMLRWRWKLNRNRAEPFQHITAAGSNCHQPSPPFGGGARFLRTMGHSRVCFSLWPRYYGNMGSAVVRENFTPKIIDLRQSRGCR